MASEPKGKGVDLRMSRDIRNLSLFGLVKHHPEDFIDDADPGIKMGENVPHSNEPISSVRLIADNSQYERFGFTPRLTATSCSESQEIKSLKKPFWKRS